MVQTKKARSFCDRALLYSDAALHSIVLFRFARSNGYTLPGCYIKHTPLRIRKAITTEARVKRLQIAEPGMP